MAALSVTAANVLMSSAGTFLSQYTAGATITAGQFVYLNSSSQWALLDTDASTGPGCGVNDVRGIALDGAASGQPLVVCIKDPSFTTGATMTNGITIYGSTTAGGITMADIPTTAAYPVILGVAISTTKINLNSIASGVVI